MTLVCGVRVTEVWSVPEASALAGEVPRAVAVLLTVPASMSAWVMRYASVHVVVAPGASAPPPHCE